MRINVLNMSAWRAGTPRLPTSVQSLVSVVRVMSFKGGDRGAERSARGRGGDGGGRALSIAREPASFGARGLERQLPRRPLGP